MGSDPTPLDIQLHRRAYLTLEVMQHLLSQPAAPGLGLQERAQWLLKSRAATGMLGAAAAQLSRTPPQDASSWLACISQTLSDAGNAAYSDDQFQARLAERLTEMMQRGSPNSTIEQSGSQAALPAPR